MCFAIIAQHSKSPTNMLGCQIINLLAKRESCQTESGSNSSIHAAVGEYHLTAASRLTSDTQTSHRPPESLLHAYALTTLYHVINIHSIAEKRCWVTYIGQWRQHLSSKRIGGCWDSNPGPLPVFESYETTRVNSPEGSMIATTPHPHLCDRLGTIF